DLARMESGKLPLNQNTVNVKVLMNRVYRKFAVLCKEQDITLKMDLDDEEIWLRNADEDRLEQVLTNLLDNAIKHTNGMASIALRARGEKSISHNEHNYVQFEIEDNGQGIPAQDVPF